MKYEKGARSQQVQQRLLKVRQGNRRMFVFLAIFAVAGAWGGHVRIQQRIEARSKENSVVRVAPVHVQQDRGSVDIVGPAGPVSYTHLTLPTTPYV